MEENEKWRGGTDMVCSMCGEPILRGQPRNATISHAPKKRECSHFFCSGGSMTLIGAPEVGVVEITSYGPAQPGQKMEGR